MATPRYIHDEEYHNSKAASRIVPVIIELFHPQSVLDVGCGVGDFLKAFSDVGVSDITGIEGAWLDQSKLKVATGNVLTRDLEQPFSLGRRFDLVLCLEVAEHLAEQASTSFVESLVQHSDVIVFSAAIPYQEGQNHINEQWIEYWKKLFADHHYVMYDPIRPMIWNDNDIFWWYRQNIVVCMNERRGLKTTSDIVNNYVHPELYLSKVAQMKAYREWVDKIFSGDIEVELAQAILNNALKRKTSI